MDSITSSEDNTNAPDIKNVNNADYNNYNSPDEINADNIIINKDADVLDGDIIKNNNLNSGINAKETDTENNNVQKTAFNQDYFKN